MDIGGEKCIIDLTNYYSFQPLRSIKPDDVLFHLKMFTSRAIHSSQGYNGCKFIAETFTDLKLMWSHLLIA